MRFTVLAFAAAVVVCATAAAPLPAAAQSPSSPIQFLDVPYLPQSEALCGGAAIAMVMRFWGVTGVYAETFASLVDKQAKGIRGQDLIDALNARNFTASSTRGTKDLVLRALDERRPLVALIEDRPGTFHYVVVVGWAGERVIVHDPARAPFRAEAEADFMRAWEKSGYWTLIATPVPGAERSRDRAAEADPAPAPATGACGGMVDEAVALAGAGQLDQARKNLEAAAGKCPEDAAPWRELAGLHALKREWRDAADDAARALRRDGRDGHAARILATAKYVEGDDIAALAAWNRIGEPTVDLVDVRGLERIRYRVAFDALGLRPTALLTPAELRRARRRLLDVPGISGARVSYQPAETGTATVTAAIVERPRIPSGLFPLTAMGVRAAINREASVDVANLTGGGEAVAFAWRWWEHRPRVALTTSAPAPFGGVWAVTAAVERETFGSPLAESAERRRSALLRVSDWTRWDLAWSATAGVERFGDTTSALVGAGLEHRGFDDRLAIGIEATAWPAINANSGRTWGGWRSRIRNEGQVWLATAGAEIVSARAPMLLWGGAGTGQGRTPLLRAHPLLDGGVIRDGVFGPRVAQASLEWRQWQRPVLRALRLAPAVFVDAARAWRGPAFADARAHVDVGAGLRVAIPTAGVLRVDLARGLRDGEMALSFGWMRD